MMYSISVTGTTGVTGVTITPHTADRHGSESMRQLRRDWIANVYTIFGHVTPYHYRYVRRMNTERLNSALQQQRERLAFLVEQ